MPNLLGSAHRAPTREEAPLALQEYVERQRASGVAALAAIEASRPSDAVLPASRLTVSPTLDLAIRATEERRSLHDNAFRQLAGRVGMPVGYANTLRQTEWGRGVLAHALDQHLAHTGERLLVRSVGTEARAILSDHYRRLDAVNVADAFVGAIRDAGAIITNGTVTDLRIRLDALHPEILWLGDDPFLVGVSLTTSDFGAGRLLASASLLRLWCLNGAVGANLLKQVHLGGRLDDNFAFSEKTYRLDTETTASAVRDVTAAALSAPKRDEMREKVERAANEKIDAKAALADLKKLFTKAESERVAEVFSFGDATQVPQGEATAWRLANAISFVAKEQDADRRLDMERVAGELIESPTAKRSVLDSILAHTTSEFN